MLRRHDQRLITKFPCITTIFPYEVGEIEEEVTHQNMDGFNFAANFLYASFPAVSL